MAWRKKLDQMLTQFAQIEEQLQDSSLPHTEIAKLSKERAELSDVVEKINTLKTAESQLVESEALLADPDMKDLAIEEIGRLRKEIPQLEQEIMLALVPKDAADERNAILEVRAGTGGEEAALFASELFTMYQRYSAIQGWRFEILEISGADQGGFKEASAMITGYNVFARMKFETGVHRVQRVPKTESGGRIHTSAATVAVLPEAEEVDVVLEDKDIRIDVMRASGPGGQSVNTTDSAVRITHLPTGIMVYMQEEKSQIKNKAKGLKILRARLYEAERERLANERAAHRKSQVGTGDRSERIRTYNFPQGRVSDHRINLTLYNADRVMTGDDLGDFIEALMANDQTERLGQLGESA